MWRGAETSRLDFVHLFSFILQRFQPSDSVAGKVSCPDHRDGSSGGGTCICSCLTAGICRYNSQHTPIHLHPGTPAGSLTNAVTVPNDLLIFSKIVRFWPEYTVLNRWCLNVVLFGLSASQAAAQARSRSAQQSAAASSITGMSLQEAQQILNISTLHPEEIQKVQWTLCAWVCGSVFS